MKMLKFDLPDGTHTFYETRKDNGDPGFVDRVVAGHVVEAAKVVKIADNDPAHDIPMSDDFVTRGLASYMEDASAMPIVEAAPEA